MNRGVKIAEKAGIGGKSARAAARLELLGGFRLSAGAHVVDISARKSRALIGILALSPGIQTTRERLTSLLWDDRSEEQARGSLRQALAGLRRDFATHGVHALVLPPDRVALDPDAISIDTVEFLSASAGAEASENNAAAALYRGPFLDGLGGVGEAFDSWLREARADLSGRAIKVLSALATSLRGTERVIAAERLVALDPLREGSHLALMEAHVANGDRALALRQYETCALLLKRELGVEPASALRAMRQSLDAIAPERMTSARVAVIDHKPTIAILPFDNMSGDPDQQYFSDGITEDLITEISRFRELRIVSRNSSFAFQGQDLSAKEIAGKLDVHFVVEGSVRKAGNRIRVTVQLIEVETDRHVWAERYDRDLDDIFAIQVEISQVVASKVAEHVEIASVARVKARPTENLTAYDHFLRFRATFRSYSYTVEQRLEPLQKAIALDPEYALAHAFMANTLIIDSFFTGDLEARREALAFAKRAMELDPEEPWSHAILGYCKMYLANLKEAGIHYEHATRLNPNDPAIMLQYALWHCFSGQADRAVEMMEEVLRRDPFGHEWYWDDYGIALVVAGRHEDAVQAFQKLVSLTVWTYVYAAIAFVNVGNLDRARSLVAAFRDEYPGQSPEDQILVEPFADKRVTARLISDLRMAL